MEKVINRDIDLICKIKSNYENNESSNCIALWIVRLRSKVPLYKSRADEIALNFAYGQLIGPYLTHLRPLHKVNKVLCGVWP